MLSLRHIELNNFGLYAGEHLLDVSTAKTRPITLVGGHNGAGKTTILEAVLLALYGRRMFGKAITAAAYTDYLQQRLHTDAEGECAEEAHVEVEFIVDDLSGSHVFRVRRSWKRRLSVAASGDQVSVWKNEQLLADLHEDKWNEYLEELIPLGIARLVFFDGEKIQTLAEDQSQSAELRQSVRSLLGLDRVERLRADLQVYIGQRADRSSPLGQQVSEAAKAMSAARSALGQAEERLGDALEREAALQAQIDDANQRLRQTGAGHAAERAELEQQRATLRERHGYLADDVKAALNRYLPFAYLGVAEGELTTILDESEQDEQARTLNGLSGSIHGSVAKRILSAQRWSALTPAPNQAQTRGLVSEALQVLAADIAPEKSPRVRFDAHDRWQIRTAITEGKSAGNAIKSQASELASIVDELSSIERQLQVIPGDDEIAPLVENLNELHRQLGLLEAEREVAQAEQARAGAAFEEAERTAAKRQKEMTSAKGEDDRVRAAGSVINVLAKFSNEYEERQVRALEDIFAASFNKLSRKRRLVERVEIDPETYEITLYRPDGTVLPRERLSAGEKQVFAIALLWSLLQLSGRKLPLIIDTPLGRLDSIHRTKLCTAYFPKASHQVLLLSTDTEVDYELAERLDRHIGRSHFLEYDHDRRQTEIVEGYFEEVEYAV